jgi:hypothetical protein
VNHNADTTVSPRAVGKLVGAGAIVFSVVYFVSDLLEVIQGDFSTFRLALTYAGEATIPLFVLGLYAMRWRQLGRLGLFGALAYAYAYVFFTSTVVYAMIAKTRNYDALSKVFGGWMTLHGLVLVVGGALLGLAVIRSGALPRWTGFCLMTGVVLVAAASSFSNVVRTIAAAFPAAAFIGMGLAVLASSHPGVSTAPVSGPQSAFPRQNAAAMERSSP